MHTPGSDEVPHAILPYDDCSVLKDDEKQCIQQLFEAQVERTPDAFALFFDEAYLTYRELNCRANRLAHYLQKRGVGPECLVAVCMQRSLDLVVALLATLKAGGAYVPLDPSYPEERLSFILSDTQASVLLTQESLLEHLSPHSVHTAQTICLDVSQPDLAACSPMNLPVSVSAQNLAYVIYTSGSTGSPKGVAVTHQSVVTLLHWARDVFTPSELMGVLASTSVCFDLSVFELFVPLSWGGQAILVENILYLPGSSAAQRVTLMNTVPSVLATLLKTERIPASVQTVNLAGEPLPLSLVEQVYRQATVQRVYNLYGPSEDTTYSTFAEIPKETRDRPLIGHPIAHTQAHVLNQALQPVPVGEVGELYLGGDGLARGYLRRPELTAERFVPNPFSDQPGTRLYRTGDLVRVQPDGALEFVGRVDTQVKLRGHRIELGEIETQLSRHEQVQEAAVLLQQGNAGDDKLLVAYLVPRAGQRLDPVVLRRHLQNSLPDYMLPSAWVMLEHLPLTLNGKVDRRALPTLDEATTLPVEGVFVPPRTPLEQVLAQIWGQILGREQISRHDHFFELGGHSLQVTLVISRIRELLQIDLPLRALFEAPTLADLAAYVENQSHRSQENQFPRVIPVSRDERLPLSFPQERVWFIHQLDPLNTAYQFQATLRFLTDDFRVEVLEQSLSEIVRRHEIFRTTFPAVDGRPVQLIHPAWSVRLPVIDLEGFSESEEEREAEIQRQLLLRSQQPFDINQLPLVRWALVRLSAQEYVLLCVEHHMVHDGWSFNRFLGELIELYKAFSAGQPSPLPELSLQFADLTYWQRQWMQGEALEKYLHFWQQQLAGAPAVLELPVDHPRPAVQSFRGAAPRIELPLNLCEALRETSRREGVTLFMTMFAAFLALLYRYTGQEDICIGSGIANRRWSESERLIGMLVNSVPLRTDLSGNPTWRELLERVRRVTLDAYEYQDIPFDKLVDGLHLERNLSLNPLFQILFSFHDSPLPDLNTPGLRIKLTEAISNQSAKFDLSLIVIPRSEQRVGRANTDAEGITVIWEYNTDLFEPVTIKKMIGHYQTLLESIAADREQHLWRIPLLSEAETHLLQQWSRSSTSASSPDTSACLHQLFAAQAQRTPDRVALRCGEHQLSYLALERHANQLAHLLRQHAVGPLCRVGVCLLPSLDLVVALLAILKAGGAYVPLDPSTPPERLAFLIADADLTLLLSSEATDPLPLSPSVPCLCLEELLPLLETQPVGSPELEEPLTAEHLAYLIYTSGSTGLPKATAVPHRAIPGFIDPLFSLDQPLTSLQHSSFSWDAFAMELWPPLLHGGCCVVLPAPPSELEALAEVLKREPIDWLWLTASLFNAIVDNQPELLEGIPLVLSGGEALSAVHVRRALNSWPQMRLINGYGPSECTVFCCAYPIPAKVGEEEKSLPIGRAIGDREVYVVDRWLQPVPVGVAGELVIGGPAVPWGYVARPELTAERLVPDPFSGRAGARLYRTGDLVRYRREGVLEFLGRIDTQVKLRGYRIELGEIEIWLRKHPQVREAAVILRQGTASSDKFLVAYLVAGEKGTPSIDELRRHLQEKLPYYMIPSFFVFLKALPRTSSQKIDRRALPAPDLSKIQREKSLDAPRTHIEQILVDSWREVLRLEQVGIHDNFFELGGDSILSIQIIARARRAGFGFTVQQLFQYQTIAELAEVVTTEQIAQETQEIVTGPVPLTSIQRWFFKQDFVEPHHWNQAMLVMVQPDARPELLEQAIHHLQWQHDALRLRFCKSETGWQQVHDAPDRDQSVPFTLIDLSTKSVPEQQAAIEAIAAEAQASLDLAKGPLARAIYFDLGKQTPGRLLFIIHHLVVDGVSWRILFEDLQMAYQQLEQDQAIHLAAKTTSFKRWAEQLQAYAQSASLPEELQYWQAASWEQITRLPRDHPNGLNTMATVGVVTTSLNSQETQALLQQVPQAYHTRINDVLLTALVLAFQHWTGRDSLLIDLEGHGREDLLEGIDLSRTVGWFTTITPIVLSLEDNGDLGTALKTIKEQLRRASSRSFSYSAFRYLEGNNAMKRQLQSLPQAEISFNYLGQFDQVLTGSLLSGLAPEATGPTRSLRGHRTHLLEISGRIINDQLHVNWIYNCAIHDNSTIEMLAADYKRALQALIEHCLSPKAGGYTPSDFAGVSLSQEELDYLVGTGTSREFTEEREK